MGKISRFWEFFFSRFWENSLDFPQLSILKLHMTLYFISLHTFFVFKQFSKCYALRINNEWGHLFCLKCFFLSSIVLTAEGFEFDQKYQKIWSWGATIIFWYINRYWTRPNTFLHNFFVFKAIFKMLCPTNRQWMGACFWCIKILSIQHSFGTRGDWIGPKFSRANPC